MRVRLPTVGALQGPRGNYAATILQDVDDGDLAMVATEHRQDADRIARALQARMAPNFAPWCSHRSFNIRAAAYRKIAVTLARYAIGRKSIGEPLSGK